MECRSAVGGHLRFVSAGVGDEPIRIHRLVTPAAAVLNPPALGEEAQRRGGKVIDRGVEVDGHRDSVSLAGAPATARRLAWARARWLRIR